MNMTKSMSHTSKSVDSDTVFKEIQSIPKLPAMDAGFTMYDFRAVAIVNTLQHDCRVKQHIKDTKYNKMNYSKQNTNRNVRTTHAVKSTPQLGKSQHQFDPLGQQIFAARVH